MESLAVGGHCIISSIRICGAGIESLVIFFDSAMRSAKRLLCRTLFRESFRSSRLWVGPICAFSVATNITFSLDASTNHRNRNNVTEKYMPMTETDKKEPICLTAFHLKESVTKVPTVDVI